MNGKYLWFDINRNGHDRIHVRIVDNNNQWIINLNSRLRIFLIRVLFPILFCHFRSCISTIFSSSPFTLLRTSLASSESSSRTLFSSYPSTPITPIHRSLLLASFHSKTIYFSTRLLMPLVWSTAGCRLFYSQINHDSIYWSCRLIPLSSTYICPQVPRKYFLGSN